MNNLKFIRLLALAMMLALLSMIVGACGGDTQGSGQENEPIKIGFSGELSGGAAEGGENMLLGVQTATDMINEQGGIKGRQVELVTSDTEMNPSRGVSIVRDFGTQEEVLAAVGGYLSTVMLAQSPLIAEEQFPFIVATSNVPDSVEQGLPWTFGVRMNAPITARYALDFLERNFGTNKVAILYESGGYGTGAAKAMTDALQERGQTPVASESFNLDDTDMTAQVTRARDAGAEAVYLMGIAASNGYVLRDMDRIGWDVPVVGEMGMVQPTVHEVAGEAADGSYVIQTANYAGEQTREMARQFLDRVEKENGSAPSMPAPSAQGFDGTMILFKAIENAELTGDLEADREAVREALETNAGPYQGVIRDWEQPFTPNNHDAIDVKSYLMNQWQDNVLVRAKEQ